MRFVSIILFISSWFLLNCTGKRKSTDLENTGFQTKLALGEELFFDRSLSRDFTLNCASCHKPDKAFADGEVVSIGYNGRRSFRNSPSLLHAANYPYFFADGGAPSIPIQVIHPIEDSAEMNMPLPQLAYRLNLVEGYRQAFLNFYPNQTTEYAITHALAEFVESLVTTSSKFDRYRSTNDSTIFTAEEFNGFKLFAGKAKCGKCHSGTYLSDFNFYNVNTGSDNDRGRERITLREKDRDAFRTPILRNLSLTAPYMHNGSVNNLPEAINHGLQYTGAKINEIEKSNLIAFLYTLNDSINNPVKQLRKK